MIKSIKSRFLWYRCYYPHWLRDALSPVCGIFLVNHQYGCSTPSAVDLTTSICKVSGHFSWNPPNTTIHIFFTGPFFIVHYQICSVSYIRIFPMIFVSVSLFKSLFCYLLFVSIVHCQFTIDDASFPSYNVSILLYKVSFLIVLRPFLLVIVKFPLSSWRGGRSNYYYYY